MGSDPARAAFFLPLHFFGLVSCACAASSANSSAIAASALAHSLACVDGTTLASATAEGELRGIVAAAVIFVLLVLGFMHKEGHLL